MFTVFLSLKEILFYFKKSQEKKYLKKYAR